MPETRKRKLSVTQWTNIIIIVAIFAGVIIYNCQKSNRPQVAFQFEEASMTLTAPDDAALSVEIQYRDILSISETTTLDVGTNLTGICTEECWFGTWRNDAYGEYTLCADPTFSDYLILETTEGTVVCNYESASMTQDLYEALQELLESKSYP